MDDVTVIDADGNVEGKLTGKNVRILGRYRGDIQVSGRLVVGEGARVDAKVKADAVEIAGHFKGELEARSLSLLEKAHTEGSLQAEVLAVKEGAVVNGSVNAGKPPAKPAPQQPQKGSSPGKPAQGVVAG